MNKKTIIRGGILAGTLIGVGLLQYFIYKTKPKAPLMATYNPKDKQSTYKTPKDSIKKAVDLKTGSKEPLQKSTQKPPVFPLKLGAKGNEVTQLQMYLLKHHGWAAVDMGVYDSITAQRVAKFLKVGQVDAALYKKLIPNPVKLQ